MKKFVFIVFLCLFFFGFKNSISTFSIDNPVIFIDIPFTIVDKNFNMKDSVWTVTVNAYYNSSKSKIEDEVVAKNKSMNYKMPKADSKKIFKNILIGFQIRIKDNMPIGSWQESTYIKNAVTINSIGKPSDNFIEVISQLFDMYTTKKFTKHEIKFAGFVVSKQRAVLVNNQHEIVLLHNYQMNNLAYDYNIGISIDFPHNMIVLQEKNRPLREKMLNIFTE